MTLSIGELWQTGLLSLQNPRMGGQRVLSWNLPREAIGPFVGITAIASTISAELNSLFHPPAIGTQVTYVYPILLPIIFAATLAVMAGVTVKFGARFGGTGEFGNTILLLSWQQVLSAAGVLGFVAIGFFSTAAAMAAFVAFGLYLIWVTTCFTAVVHGFSKMGTAFLVTIVSLLIGAAFNLFLLSLFGVSVVQGEVL